MPEPLTKHERFNIQTCPLTGREKELVDSYEATVAALEAELAHLRPLAEVGEAVEGMADAAGGGLSLETPHRLRPTWRLWGNHMGYRRTLVAEAETLSALFATIKADDAVLRAAKGETDG